jgi:hypothetical protein
MCDHFASEYLILSILHRMCSLKSKLALTCKLHINLYYVRHSIWSSAVTVHFVSIYCIVTSVHLIGPPCLRMWRVEHETLATLTSKRKSARCDCSGSKILCPTHVSGKGVSFACGCMCGRSWNSSVVEWVFKKISYTCFSSVLCSLFWENHGPFIVEVIFCIDSKKSSDCVPLNICHIKSVLNSYFPVLKRPIFYVMLRLVV